MLNKLPEYELLAIRYATRRVKRCDVFIGETDETVFDMDYYVWVARRGNLICVIDTGYSHHTATKRGRRLLRNPVDGMRAAGIDPLHVNHVVLTHLHYDHCGNLDKFPHATFHVQLSEFRHATGPSVREDRVALGFELEDIKHLVELNFQKRLMLYEGQAEIAPGITTHLVGGHSIGLQFVRVHTRRGWVVIASDAAVFYENITTRRPFYIMHDLSDTLAAYDQLLQSAVAIDFIVPGHDAKVMAIYPPLSRELTGVAVRLDADAHYTA
ncbi:MULTISPECIES: N-acyl homoserine lactonase family protein [unclassified Chelatococcus]|uniref:N-acyl homoserine lactonase family protein n=1 Tax=unclassified Chelatococcus TaxID=2638111 RepID=UPI001BCD9634|nr:MULTISPECIES: N-acyl homoserine lactonase family protein [unclassified Chelatococcus]MBS7697447.1 N-acyl homoserine lactonase family protein [Chelatococcus sp. YT9]MBX3559242.1 N-acyl homoserine lactonase family protein [Chelatococcus sp.]